MSAVYYFSRTGVSEAMAKKLAENLNVKAHKLDDGMNWNGMFGFIKGGFYASTKKSIPAKYEDPKADENILLVMPLWAGGFPPAVRGFIDKIGRNRITLVVTSMSSELKDREGFVRVIDIKGKDIQENTLKNLI